MRIAWPVYLEKIAALTVQATSPGGGPGGYPVECQSAAQRALYNNLGSKRPDLALAVDSAVKASLWDGWRDNAMKTKKVRLAIRFVLAAEYPPNQPQGVQGACAQPAGDRVRQPDGGHPCRRRP